MREWINHTSRGRLGSFRESHLLLRLTNLCQQASSSIRRNAEMCALSDKVIARVRSVPTCRERKQGEGWKKLFYRASTRGTRAISRPRNQIK